jgi:hypothetical protein
LVTGQRLEILDERPLFDYASGRNQHRAAGENSLELRLFKRKAYFALSSVYGQDRPDTIEKAPIVWPSEPDQWPYFVSGFDRFVGTSNNPVLVIPAKAGIQDYQ